MKVLYFLNSFDRGGAELGLIRLVEGGMFAGCDLSIASIVRGSGQVADALEEHGIEPTIFVDRRRMRLRDVAAAGWGLMRRLRQDRPDVLVLSLPQANIVGRVVGRLAGVRTIVSFEHNTRLAKPIYELAYRLLAGSVTAAFVDCEATWNVVAERFYGHASLPHFVVPLVTLPDVEPPRPQVPTRPYRVISVGRLTAPKAHEIGIEAIALLKREGVDVELDIAGEGERKIELLTLADHLGVTDRVHLIGFVEQWWKQKRHSAFLLTSRHEGLCIAALEAMWSGLPVIAPRVGGIRDYGSADNMALLDECTPREVADTLRRVLEDRDLAIRLATNGQRTALERFGDAVVRERYARLNSSLRSGLSSS